MYWCEYCHHDNRRRIGRGVGSYITRGDTYSALSPSGQLSWHDIHEEVNKTDSLQPFVAITLFSSTFLAFCVVYHGC